MSSNNKTEKNTYDGDAQKQVMSDALKNIMDFMDRNPQYWELNPENSKANDNVICCNNDKFLKLMCLIHATKAKKKEYTLKIKDNKNVYTKFIYDKKDGVFKTKNKNRILAPHMITLIQAIIILGDDKDNIKKMEELYYGTYGGWNCDSDAFYNEVKENRIKNHTGNHYRNKNINVPPSVYGIK